MCSAEHYHVISVKTMELPIYRDRSGAGWTKYLFSVKRALHTGDLVVALADTVELSSRSLVVWACAWKSWSGNRMLEGILEQPKN
jgi:hypothetical protein